MQAIVETLFDAVYLVTVITLGIIMILNSAGRRQYWLFGIMAVVLGLGDSFHLIPRALALCTTGLENYTVALGAGKLITSVTMTVFYILLYYVWRNRYHITGKNGITAAVGIYRNIRFALFGLLIIILFFQEARRQHDTAFQYMWLTIVLSFGFYIPVVLWADVIPMIGMLMIPKTCAYVWTVLIGYRAMRSEN